MRAIDADAVPQEFWEYEFDGKWRSCTIKDLLDSQPTIQTEIVRCEECLYRKICSWEKQGAKFCSFAERREETT